MGIIDNVVNWIKSKFVKSRDPKKIYGFASDYWYHFKAKRVKVNKRYRTVYDVYRVTKFHGGDISRIKLESHKSLGYILNEYGIHADKVSQETIVRSRR